MQKDLYGSRSTTVLWGRVGGLANFFVLTVVIYWAM